MTNDENFLKIEQSIFDKMPFGCVFCRQDAQKWECNDRIVQLFGLDNREQFSQCFRKLSPEFQPNGERSVILAQKLVRQVLETGKSNTFRWWHLTLDGTPLPVEVTLTREIWEGENVAVAFFRSMSEVDRLSHIIEEQNIRTQMMLDSMPFGVIFFDEKGNNIDCNETSVRMFELTDKQEYLDRFHELSPPLQPCGTPSRQLTLKRIQTAFSKGLLVFEWMHQNLRGELMPAEITLLRTSYNGKPAILGYTRDLRQEHEADKAKNDFLANVSHELRTPLNGILNLTELLLLSVTDPKQYEYLDMIVNSAKSLLVMMNDLLALSNIRAGKMELHPHDFDLYDMVQQVQHITAVQAEAKCLKLIVTFDGENRLVYGDENSLRQVLLRLTDNAVRYTKNGGVEIRIETEGLENGDVCVRCSVADTGIGIAPNMLEQIFEVFSQADSSRTRKYGGTGIGLAMAQHIVGLMGGRIVVKSVFQRGSVFSFEIVLPPVMIEMDEESHMSSVILEPQQDTDRIVRILAADDSRINQIVIREMLTAFGYRCDIVENGRQVIDCLRFRTDENYDVILMDCQMPEMDGYEATQWIRNWEQENGRKPIPIIAVTAHDLPQDRAKCLQSGMNSYCSKPINRNLLITLIEAALGH
ncbi:MAG: response regulator [Planctomycetaceae bacterium]|jgi:signal transduction histidine kinase/CheY-like chemotaxis protein|nr:response regulator [Planctomycetaceae bacterium]